MLPLPPPTQQLSCSHWNGLKSILKYYSYLFSASAFQKDIYSSFCCESKNECFIRNIVKIQTHEINASSEFSWGNCVLLFKGRLVDQQHYRRDASPTMFSHVYIIFFTNDYVEKVNVFKDNPGYEKFMLSISFHFWKSSF